MKIILARLAQQELKEAYDFYASEHQNLALRFKAEIHSSISKITEFPEAHALHI